MHRDLQAMTETLETSMRYVRSRGDRANSVVSQMAAAIRTLARAHPDECSVLLQFSYSLEASNSVEKVDVVACPALPSIPNEIVRADIDKNDFASITFPLCDLLRLELEPFIVGVGWVIVDETDDGIVVRRVDPRKI